ncbi:metallophosphoesterase [Prolixibacter sp. SD074]|uniref:metallophosphoesterase family protein n=1 Tax=Prolixibacter sp. SD074 TaxID=2652391 RepID=UPI00126D6ADB|nr:metallophosphoesterase [Prolixibacter sp. SD074]GET31002.1 hypothetical protein SD074_32040 [Prolixibacter sp. SD074]
MALKRREFIRKSAIWAGVLAINLSMQFCTSGPRPENVSFAVCSEVNADVIPDAATRLKEFVKAAEKNHVDFIISLGAFCPPKPEYREFINIWDRFDGDSYQVIGEHDLDEATKNDFIRFTDMPSNYYAFEKGNIHFIVLDTNYLFFRNEYIGYNHGNFYDQVKKGLNYVSPKELDWLKKELKRSNLTTIIFSHQSLEDPKGCANGADVRKILEEANKEAGYTKVIAAFSGHGATDVEKAINGIHYIRINSMSYRWVGEDYQSSKHYTAAIDHDFPLAKFTLPYKEPLYGIVKITPGKLTLTGKQTSFILPGPANLGVPYVLNGSPVTPEISNRQFTWRKPTK